MSTESADRRQFITFLLSLYSLDDGTWRSTIFYDTLNTTFVATALRAARAADPSTKLYLNDYNIDGTGSSISVFFYSDLSDVLLSIGAKSTAYINLVRDLKAQGVPIDGLGLQGHLIVGSVPNTIQQNIEQMVAAGVDVRTLSSLVVSFGRYI